MILYFLHMHSFFMIEKKPCLLQMNRMVGGNLHEVMKKI